MKFPLILSCGHTTPTSIDNLKGCGCYDASEESPIDRVKFEFVGKWRPVLEGYGMKLGNPRKEGPCPVCGGKTRFRFDDLGGQGTSFCSHCTPHKRDGLGLLTDYLSKPVYDVAQELLGNDTYKSIAPRRVNQADEDAVRKANVEQAKKGAKLLLDSAKLASHPYMDNKGFGGEWLTNGDPMMNRGGITQPGEILLVPIYKSGELVNIQKIKADGEKRPLTGGDMSGVYHPIDGKTKHIAITEGFATGMTINKATSWKTYVSFNTANLAAAVKTAKDEHPDAAIIIFGDHDDLDEKHGWRPGEHWANEAAAAYGAGVVLPKMQEDKCDWDDYRQEHGMDALKSVLREKVTAELKAIKPKSFKKPQSQPKQEPKLAPQPTPETAPAFGSWNATSAAKPKAEKSYTIESLPDGVSLDGVDIEKPPGFAGEIAQYMKDEAHREVQGGICAAFAVQTLSMAGSYYHGYRGVKLCMISIILAESAGGKEKPQEIATEFLSNAGVTLYGDIRSDKDIITAAAFDDGRCFYVKDEAHTLLGAVANNGKSSHTSTVPDLMMEMSTKPNFKLSKLHADEFISKISLRKSRLEKEVVAKEDIKLGFNVELEQAKIKKIEQEIEEKELEVSQCESNIEAIKRGIKRPALNFVPVSTSHNLANVVDDNSIKSGFLGRALVFDGGEYLIQKRNMEEGDFEKWDAKVVKTQEEKARKARIQARINMIVQESNEIRDGSIEAEFFGEERQVTGTLEARKLIWEISRHYEKHYFLNHLRLKSLFARIEQRINCIVSCLALDNIVDGKPTFTVDDVLWAYKVALSSILRIASWLKINEAVEGQTVEDKLEGIKEAILKRLTVPENDEKDGWRYKSELKNYLKRQKYYQEISKEILQHGQDAMENALAVLMGEGKVIRHPENDKKIKRCMP